MVGQATLLSHLAYGFIKSPETLQEYDLGSLQLLFVSDFSLNKSVINMTSQYPELRFVDMYGMAECPAMITDTPENMLAGSIGRLDFGISACIVGQNDLPIGKMGGVAHQGAYGDFGPLPERKRYTRSF